MIEIAAVSGIGPAAMMEGGSMPNAAPIARMGFEDMLSSGLNAVETKVSRSEDLVRQFAVDDSIPVHQVTIALEEARLAVELAMQVRTRLVEGYRELMNMQL